MAARGSCPGQPERDAAGQRLALAGQQRRVGGDDGDDAMTDPAPAGGLRPRSTFEPVAGHRVVICISSRADMSSGNGQFVAGAEVGLNEGGHGEGRVAVCDHAATTVPLPPLNS